MKSFSSFKPVHDGTPTQIKTKTFAMWLRANAHNIRSPFCRDTWRTARPWLSFHDVRYQLKLFRERTLGSIVVSGIQLRDDDVETAVKYEAYATRQICSQDVRQMVLEFYDYSRMNEIPKRKVMETINEEFAYMDRGYVTSRDRSWKQGIKKLSERGICTLKPKISEHKVAELIMDLYDLGGEEVETEKVYYSLLPFLNKMGESLHADSPIIRRALHITGHKLTFKNHRQIIEGTIRKYYVSHKLAKEPLERLQYVVNLKCNIPPENKVWDVIDLNIVPKHDFQSDEYEICLDKKYHNPPIVTPMQEPFMKYSIQYKYVRKKQKIPWRCIFKYCRRTGGTTKETLDTVNKMIEKNGFIPYDHAHPEFDRLKMQGLNLHNISSASLEQTPIRFPLVSTRKRKRPDESEQSDSEDSQHSDE
jgi:hypothetical protein